MKNKSLPYKMAFNHLKVLYYLSKLNNQLLIGEVQKSFWQHKISLKVIVHPSKNCSLYLRLVACSVKVNKFLDIIFEDLKAITAKTSVANRDDSRTLAQKLSTVAQFNDPQPEYWTLRYLVPVYFSYIEFFEKIIMLYGYLNLNKKDTSGALPDTWSQMMTRVGELEENLELVFKK